MKSVIAVILLGALLGSAFAKLPPPTPEEKAKAEKKAEEKKVMTEREAKELARVQEEVARRYRGNVPPDAQSAKIKPTEVPKAAKQAPGAPAKPYTHQEPKSNEGQAHSQAE